MRTSILRVLLFGFFAITLILSACGGEKETTTTAPTTTTATTTTTPTTTTTTSTPTTTTTTTEAAGPPMAGEWVAQTGSSEFTFAFTVDPNSTGIPVYSIYLTEFKCEGTQMSGGWDITHVPMLPITGGQFTFKTKERVQYGSDWDIVILGKFDETGIQASGTWQISAGEITCASGTWTSTRE